MPLAIQQCSVHAERRAFARCMGCTATLCHECATQWDGIWHCATCLVAKRETVVERSGAAAWIAMLATSLIFLYIGARAMVWTGALIAGMF